MKYLPLSVAMILASTLPAKAADFYLYGAYAFVSAESEDATEVVEIDDGRGGALAFGWDFTAGPAIEIALDGASAVSNGVDVAQGSLAFNFYYAPRIDLFQPRIGVGLGAISIEVDDGSEAETAAMAQASGGFMIWFGEHIAIGPTYRYRYTEVPISGLDDPQTEEHLIEAGLKISF